MSKLIDSIIKNDKVNSNKLFTEKISHQTAKAIADKRVEMVSEINISEGMAIKKKLKWVHTGPYREHFGGGHGGPDESYMTHEYWDLMPEGKGPKNNREGESKFGHIIKGNWIIKKDGDKISKKKMAEDEKYQAYLPRANQSPRTGSDHLGDFDSLEHARGAIEAKLEKSKFDIG